MKRYSKIHEINGTKLALMYASYAPPMLEQGYDSFKEILSPAGFSKNQIDRNNRFGFRLGTNICKIVPQTFTGSCMSYSWFYTKKQIINGNEQVILECKYSSGPEKSLISIAHGMNTCADSLDNILDIFTQKTGFKEIDFSKSYLKKLNKSNFPWDILLGELRGYSK